MKNQAQGLLLLFFMIMGLFSRQGTCAQTPVANFSLTGYQSFPFSDLGNWKIQTADFDQNGTMDLFLPRAHQPDLIIKNYGNDLFIAEPDTNSWQVEGGSYDAEIVDIDGDGDLDIIVARGPESGRSSVLIPSPELLLIQTDPLVFEDQSFRLSKGYGGYPNLYKYNYSQGVAVGDLDNDGLKDDLVFANGGIGWNPTLGPVKNLGKAVFQFDWLPGPGLLWGFAGSGFQGGVKDTRREDHPHDAHFSESQ